MRAKRFFLSFYYRLELVPVSFAAARAGVTQCSPTPQLRGRLDYYEDRLHWPKGRRTKNGHLNCKGPQTNMPQKVGSIKDLTSKNKH